MQHLITPLNILVGMSVMCSAKGIITLPNFWAQLSESGLCNSKSGGKYCRLCVRVLNLGPRPSLRLDPTSWVV